MQANIENSIFTALGTHLHIAGRWLVERAYFGEEFFVPDFSHSHVFEECYWMRR